MKKIIVIIIVVLMLLSTPVSGLLETAQHKDDKPVLRLYIRPRPNNVIVPYLEGVLENSGPSDRIDVLVRFRQGIKAQDYDLIRNIGLRPIRTFEFIDGIQVNGNVASIRELAQSQRVQIMEGNEKMILLMDESTTTINASRVWNTRILDRVGKTFPGIDGTGVTVVVLDSGVDAGHPDLDYREKVIMNLKSDSDGGWVEMENSDTSSGHGTHVAGTIAGNGDASAGARRGVAPGAKIIGLSTGEAIAIFNAVGALEWVYEHSRPNNNPYNIRAVSNSWGSSGDYDPNSAITIASQKITYENNVAVVFAAGNEGSGNHDGTTVTTNPYSLTPSVFSIAAMERDGSGIADFSSRGISDNNFTWPDFGAPGVKIWATEARKTLITTMRNQDPVDRNDAYYMAISGTSMATPHISGVTALLFQAAPSLRVSEMHDDSMENDSAYWEDPSTRIHEIEWILEATARYINVSGDNGVPENHSMGHEGLPYDYAQGYGLVQVDKAIALALTLEELRVDDPETTVKDALQVYKNVMVHNSTTRRTNRLSANWFGDWSELNDGSSSIFSTTTKDVLIPNGTTEMNIVLNYNPAKSDGWQIGEATVTIDQDGDGSSDWDGGSGYDPHGYKEWTIPVSNPGIWRFNVEAHAIQIPDWWRWRHLGDNEFNEASMEYTIGITLTLDVPADTNVSLEPWDYHSRNAILDWTDPTPDYDSNLSRNPSVVVGITQDTYWYDLSKAKVPKPVPGKDLINAEFPWIVAIGVLIVIILGTVMFMRKKGIAPFGKKSTPRPSTKIKDK